MSSLVIASDLGSSGCKTVAVDMDNGGVVAAARADYPTHYDVPGWAEQDPDDWYRAFADSVRQVAASPSVNGVEIAGLAIIGVTHTAVLLGSDGRPLAPSILMFDSRSVDEAKEITERFGDEVAKRTLNTASSVWTFPQLAWVKANRPELWSQVASITFQKDYVRQQLIPGNVTDHIDAAGSLLFDPIESAWIVPFCDELELDLAKLPEVVEPSATVGVLSQHASEATGLLPGIPVLVGTTDTVAEMVGSGAVRTGEGIVKLASVGRLAVVAENPVVENGVLNYRHLADGLWYPGTASKYAASAYRWLRNTVWPDLGDADAYAVMDQAAATVPPGSEGVIFHPHLNGQWAPYWDDRLRASFLGITTRHGREHLTRAVLEGVAFSIRDALDDLETHGLVAEDFRLIGQGSVSPLWAQMMADVIEKPLLVPAQVDAAYGAALVAAIGVGLLDNTPSAVKEIIEDGRIPYDPNAEASGAYGELFEIYQESVVEQQLLGERLWAFETRNQRGQ